MATPITLTLLILTFLPLVHSAELRLIPANVPQPWPNTPVLKGRTRICPQKYFPSFSIQCITTAADSAEFYLNGKFFHREYFTPYTLTGDSGGIADPWKNPPRFAKIYCRSNLGDEAYAEVTFQCPSNPPPKPPTTKPPSTGDKCVSLKATNFAWQKGWVFLNGGMAYKPYDWSTGIDPAGDFPLVFKFRAPATSRYGFTIDMKTSGGVDHNDVWGMIEGQTLSLERPGSWRTKNGHVKLYHNRNGRATEAFSVDFDPHVISTKWNLQQGKEYTVRVSGRSTKVTVFRVLLFTCSGKSCRAGWEWNTKISKCA